MLPPMNRTRMRRALAVTLVLGGTLAARPGAAAAPDPRLVLGLYSVPAAACSLAAAAGFTVVHSYDFEKDSAESPAQFITRARTYLDAAERSGLRVALGLPRNWSTSAGKATFATPFAGCANILPCSVGMKTRSPRAAMWQRSSSWTAWCGTTTCCTAW